ncbi:TPA: glycosyltransferase [Yersinia enterocolitica]|nr:glycosyltransferase [Yersinia enterocolitica]UYJ86261.1 glycosyltransferase [Yersinia enterocolitica]UYK16117.1 glycosyltransferase [Yersinia enterocolitica]HEN3469059.1 glycosyltransferase [Yersinia enterocolitica]
MRILHICYSDLDGGAARAAYRLHRAQRKIGLDSKMLVVYKMSDDPHVFAVSKLTKLRIKILNFISVQLLKLQRESNNTHRSLNIFPSGIMKYIKNICPDVINLHWVGGEMLSIGEISHIKLPLVWTLHDMWVFSGCKHYDNTLSESYKTGYSKLNRESDFAGLDIDRIIYKYKYHYLKPKPIHFISPSRWLGECIKSSTLFQEHSVAVISNCIDHQVYRPIDKKIAREILNLPINRKLLLFGAMSSTSDPRKGYALLKNALLKLKEENKADKVELIIFGASGENGNERLEFPIHYMGRVYDDTTLCLLYSAADLFIAPSLQDNLPNTIVESLACGTPCIAFDIGGMPDLILSTEYGHLVNPVNATSLYETILEQLSINRNSNILSTLSASSRSEEVVASKYNDIYKSICVGESK